MKVDIAAIRQACDAWWNRANTGPLTYFIFPEGDWRAMQPVTKPWMPRQITDAWCNWKQEMLLGRAIELFLDSGDEVYINDALDFLGKYPSVTGYAGEGYPFYLPGLGPGCLAAVISNFARYVAPTIWFEGDEPFAWERLLEITPDVSTPYRRAVEQFMPRVVERLQPQYVIAMPDLGVGLDTLSSLRHAQTLLLDVYDHEDTLPRALDNVCALWLDVYRRLDAVISPGNHGCHAETMRYLSGAPTHIAYCDFAAMISPAMFERYVLPILRREAALFGNRTVFHVDGPGMVAHVDLICSVPGVFAIQWVPGAGNPGALSEQWDSLYRKIIDHGRRICLAGIGTPDELTAFFRKFPATEFYVPATCRTRREAEALLRVCA